MKGLGIFLVFAVAFVFTCPICHCLVGNVVNGLLGGSNSGESRGSGTETSTRASNTAEGCSPPEGYTKESDGLYYMHHYENLSYWQAMSKCHKHRARLPFFSEETMYDTIKGIIHDNRRYIVGLLSNETKTVAEAIPPIESSRVMKWNDGTSIQNLQYLKEPIFLNEGKMCMVLVKDKILSDNDCRKKLFTLCQFSCADKAPAVETCPNGVAVPTGFTSVMNNFYKLIEPMNFTALNSTCRSQGARIVTIRNQFEAISLAMFSAQFNVESFFVGLTNPTFKNCTNVQDNQCRRFLRWSHWDAPFISDVDFPVQSLNTKTRPYLIMTDMFNIFGVADSDISAGICHFSCDDISTCEFRPLPNTTPIPWMSPSKAILQHDSVTFGSTG